MILKTERLHIHLATDEEMRTWIAGEPDEGLTLAYGEMLAAARQHPEARQWYAAWFMETEDNTRIGELCFKGLAADGTVEIGYGVEPAFQNRGYATEAVRAITKWALSEPGVRRISAETEDDNPASQKVLLKAGFLPTGERGEEGPLFSLTKGN